MANVRKNRTAVFAIIGTAVLAGILLGTAFWMGRSARRDTESVVRSVSNLYLDELAGRRKQVVEHNLAEKAQIFEKAIAVMTEEDRSDREHMMAYQSRIMRLLSLDQFSFVDEDGLMYNAAGQETSIADYGIDWRSLQEPKCRCIIRAMQIRLSLSPCPRISDFRIKRLRRGSSDWIWKRCWKALP